MPYLMVNCVTMCNKSGPEEAIQRSETKSVLMADVVLKNLMILQGTERTGLRL